LEQKGIRSVRRFDNFKDASYEKDALKDTRLKVQLNEEDKDEIDPDKVSEMAHDLFTIGINSCIGNKKRVKIRCEMLLAEATKFEKIVSNLTSTSVEIEETDYTTIINNEFWKPYFKKYFMAKYNEDLSFKFKSFWIHLKLGMFSMLQAFVDSTNSNSSVANFPLFNVYWDFSVNENWVEILKVNKEFEEQRELFENTHYNYQLHRVQNFFLNLCFRSLVYSNQKDNLNKMEEEECYIYFRTETAFNEACNLASIEDFSVFLLILLKYEIITASLPTLLHDYQNGWLLKLRRLNDKKAANDGVVRR